jgi:hypothetical protein
MGNEKMTLGAAIDAVIAALDPLEQSARETAVVAACRQLNITGIGVKSSIIRSIGCRGVLSFQHYGRVLLFAVWAITYDILRTFVEAVAKAATRFRCSLTQALGQWIRRVSKFSPPLPRAFSEDAGSG